MGSQITELVASKLIGDRNEVILAMVEKDFVKPSSLGEGTDVA